MVCEHLADLERSLLAAEIPVTCRGSVWSENCREWIYFDCYLDRPAIRAEFLFASCVEDHEHLGTHDGKESGFVCAICHDGIMGVHPTDRAGKTSFP